MTELALDGVSKQFGDELALAEVSLSIADGEFFTLLGPSGCGKTTTLRIVAGLTAPSEGTVRLGGTDMAGVPPEKRNVGIVFQHYALFPHLSVAENVAYGLRYNEVPNGATEAERVGELLELVDLEGFGDRDPETLSGGQKQRVALARALAPGPDLLLLDEPMSALDARLRDRLRRTIREIQSELSITTLYVTHDQAEALSVSDRIAVMRDGRIEQVGPPEQVYTAPENPFVAGFVGENNLFEVQSVTGSTATLACGADVELPGVEPGMTFSVRPEAMGVVAGAERSGGPTLEATVESTAFQGGRYTLTCRVGDRTVYVESDHAPEGSGVTIEFSPADVQVFQRSRSGQ